MSPVHLLGVSEKIAQMLERYGFVAGLVSLGFLGLLFTVLRSVFDSGSVVSEYPPEVDAFGWTAVTFCVGFAGYSGFVWWVLQGRLPVSEVYVDSQDALRVADILYGLPDLGLDRLKAVRAVRDEVERINEANRVKVDLEVSSRVARELNVGGSAVVTSGLSVEGATRIHDTVKQEYGAFLSDPLEVVAMPLLADGGLSDVTRAFERLLVVADDAQRSGDQVRYGQVVLELSEAWDDARAYAELHGADTLPAASQAALRRAKKLLAQALDDATPPHVAAAAVRQAEQLLRGVMSVPAVTRGVLGGAVRAELPGVSAQRETVGNAQG